MRKQGSTGELSAAFGALALGALLVGCAGDQQAPAESPLATNPAPAGDQQTAETSPATTTAPEEESPSQNQAQETMVVADAGFLAPESVLYDPDQDVYFISNVNGESTAKDGNGFISKVGPDGKVIDLKWIDGAKPNVNLNAPKGMGITGNFLYVTDIDVLRIFDKKTGASRGELFVKGATFLNDIAVAEDGTVYVTDTGWKSGKEGMENSGSDAVFKVDPKVVAPREVVKAEELGNPNGITVNAGGIWAVTAGGELYRITADGKREQQKTLPSKGLDGLVTLEDGTLLVSSWESSSVYMGQPGGEFTVIAADLKSPADIGYDSKRGRLLVPQMTENKVAIYTLPGRGSDAMAAAASQAGGDQASKPGMTPASGTTGSSAARTNAAQPQAGQASGSAASSSSPAAPAGDTSKTSAPQTSAPQTSAPRTGTAPATSAATPK